jgi:imidazolonepropionase-like amidohydrolase
MAPSIRRLLMILAATLTTPAAQAGTTLIHAGELLAVPGEKPTREQTIVVRGERVVEVRDGYLAADDLAPEYGGEIAVIDLRDHFVLPGLMDMHVHLQHEMGPGRVRDRVQMSKQQMQMRSVMYAMRTLEAGFTTVREAGSSTQEMYALRDGIEKGWIDGPRIIASGGVGITGGHGDVSGVKNELMDLWTHERICDGPYDCRRATRHAIKYGADWIKIAATGGVMTDRATGTGQQMEADELREVVSAAHRMGRKVMAHAHEEEGIIAALEAGVDSIEHGSYTGPEAIKRFRKSGAYLVPTLLAGKTVKESAETSDVLSAAQKEKAIRVGTEMAGSFERAHKAGVRVAYGTDSGVSPHGTNADEALLMVEAGMSEMDVLVSATVSAADLIDHSDSLGTLEPGKYADIIAVSASPLEDISELQDVDFVMKGGKVYKQESDS